MSKIKALITAEAEELENYKLQEYFQKGSITEVIGLAAGNQFCVCKTLDGSMQKAIHRSLLFCEHDFVKISAKPKNSAIPKAHYDRVARVSKIIDSATIRVVVMNNLEYNMNVNDLKHV